MMPLGFLLVNDAVLLRLELRLEWDLLVVLHGAACRHRHRPHLAACRVLFSGLLPRSRVAVVVAAKHLPLSRMIRSPD
jgi:hypothetical protein